MAQDTFRAGGLFGGRIERTSARKMQYWEIPHWKKTMGISTKIEPLFS